MGVYKVSTQGTSRYTYPTERQTSNTTSALCHFCPFVFIVFRFSFIRMSIWVFACMFISGIPGAGGGQKRIADLWNWSWLWGTMQVWELNLRPMQEGQMKWRLMVWTHNGGLFANYLHVLVLLALCCWTVCHDSIERKRTKTFWWCVGASRCFCGLGMVGRVMSADETHMLKQDL